MVFRVVYLEFSRVIGQEQWYLPLFHKAGISLGEEMPGRASLSMGVPEGRESETLWYPNSNCHLIGPSLTRADRIEVLVLFMVAQNRAHVFTIFKHGDWVVYVSRSLCSFLDSVERTEPSAPWDHLRAELAVNSVDDRSNAHHRARECRVHDGNQGKHEKAAQLHDVNISSLMKTELFMEKVGGRWRGKGLSPTPARQSGHK